MGRPGLTLNRKFLQLVNDLKPHCKGFEMHVARGALELLWEPAYEAGNDYLGTPGSVESQARWTGKKGVLFEALLMAGGEGEKGFIEVVEGRQGHYQIHDLFENAPEYVQKRLKREAERNLKGQTIRSLRQDAARKMHQLKGHANGLQTDAIGSRLHAKVLPPAPAPAPAPAPGDLVVVESAQHGASISDAQRSAQDSIGSWPIDILEALHKALGRKLLQANDQAWMAFVGQSSQYPVAQRVAAAREYIGRRHRPGEHEPSYVLAMIAKSAGTKLAPPPKPAAPSWKSKGYSSEREMLEARYRINHDLTIDQPLPPDWENEVRNGV